jgi:hypothetical protein
MATLRIKKEVEKPFPSRHAAAAACLPHLASATTRPAAAARVWHRFILFSTSQ